MGLEVLDSALSQCGSTVNRHVASQKPCWGSVLTFSLTTSVPTCPLTDMQGTALEKGCGERGRGFYTANLDPSPSAPETLFLLSTVFSTSMFSWASSYPRVGENRGDIREGTLHLPYWLPYCGKECVPLCLNFCALSLAWPCVSTW